MTSKIASLFKNRTKRIVGSAIIAILVVCGVALSDYLPDIIVTSPDGAWTDTRAYADFPTAITAIGANVRDVYVVRQEDFVTDTVPANVRLHFYAGGCLNNTGQLTFQTKSINAGDKHIFIGTGDIDFAAGSVVRSTWFDDIVTAFDLVEDDTLTLIIANADNIDADCTCGNCVQIRWEAPGNILTVDAGFTLDNIYMIEAGNFQIFAGDGDFDFLDGTWLNLDWFIRLRECLAWVEDELVTITVPGVHVVDFNETLAANERLDLQSRHGVLSVSAGQTVTFHSPGAITVDKDRLTFTGDGDIAYSNPGMTWAELYKGGIDGVSDDVQINYALQIAKCCELLAKTYITSAEITLDDEGMVLIGAGKDLTTISYSGAGSAVAISDAATTTKYTRVGGFSISGTAAGAIGLEVDRAWFSNIYDIVVYGFENGYGCKLYADEAAPVGHQGCYFNRFRDCSFGIGGKTGNDVGMLIQTDNYAVPRTNNNTLTNNTFEQNTSDGLQVGAGVQELTVINPLTQNNGGSGFALGIDPVNITRQVAIIGGYHESNAVSDIDVSANARQIKVFGGSYNTAVNISGAGIKYNANEFHTEAYVPGSPIGHGYSRTSGFGWAYVEGDGATSGLLGVVEGQAAGDTAIYTEVTGDAEPRLIVQYNGRLEFGDGALVADTFLQRGGVGKLSTPGHLHGGDGVSTLINAGAVGDGVFAQVPLNGTVAIDTVNDRFYIRYGGNWHYIDVDGP